MCEFISWVEHNGKTYFLIYHQIHETKRGQECREYSGSSDDFLGHGFIRLFYNLPETGDGNRECTDFSNPDRFPAAIVDALKAGEFAGLATPRGLLSDTAFAQFEKVRQAAWAEYRKVEQDAFAQYEKVTQDARTQYVRVKQAARAEYRKVEQPALIQYEKVKQAAFAQFEKVEQAARTQYVKVTQDARAEYRKVEQDAFWTLFADISNRVPAWRS